MNNAGHEERGEGRRAHATASAAAEGVPRKIRVFLIDDQVVFREGVKEVLRPESDVQVIGESGGRPDILDRALSLRPDVVVIDTATSEGDGVEVIKMIRARCPQTKAIVLTWTARPEQLSAAIAAGAWGCASKVVAPPDLVDAIRAADGGGAPRRPFTTVAEPGEAAAHRAIASFPAAARGFRELTPREADVLSAVASGLRDRDIAAQLVLSEATVKSHLRAIYRKFQVRNRAQMAAMVIKTGLLQAGTGEPPGNAGSTGDTRHANGHTHVVS